MIPTRGAGRWSSDTIVVALLAATLAVVSVLLAQALVTVRAHERVVAATLDDFAAYAAERVAADLNSTFSSIFLDEITASRAGHYAWVAGREPPARGARRGADSVAISSHFSIDGDSVVSRGGPIDAALVPRLVAEIRAHAAEVYPEPAPYALLRPGDWGDGLAFAYRKEEAYEGVALFGFLIRFADFRTVYRRVVTQSSILPPSLVGEIAPARLMTVRLSFPQSGRILFETLGPTTGRMVTGEATAAKAGRLVVTVEMDAETARALIPGASRTASLPLFGSLTLLTLGLLAVAVVLQRRGARLAQMREAFLANVSHDLRTPLAQIRMFSETLLLGRLTDEDERRRSLEIIRREAAGLSDLVDNIVHASGRAGPPLRPEPTDLDRLVRHTVDTLRPSADAKGVTLAPRVTGRTPTEVDAVALRRILVNLIDNAIKYGPRGQVVTITLEGGEDGVEVVVEDQGPGVPRRERARVWERFVRLPHDDVGVTGTGIGLAVVRGLAEQHGGSVRMDAGSGGGARVFVRLASGASG